MLSFDTIGEMILAVSVALCITWTVQLAIWAAQL